MTTEQEGSDQESPLELPVTFAGREIFVRMPTPEKLLVWQRTIARLGNVPDDATWTGSEVMKSLERLRKIVDSVMANKADIEWLDDQFLDGELTFQDLAPFITYVAQAFQKHAETNGNREERRAAVKKTPAKKAVRKAPVR